MVLSSWTSLAISWGDLWKKNQEEQDTTIADVPEEHPSTWVPNVVFFIGMGAALVFSVWCQVTFFGIPVVMGVFSVLIAFVLAAVAARVSGTTGITPKGALGKVSQLSFGLWAQGQVVPNLMAANVTAGAAAHSADILHDLKTGHLLGASPRAQLVGQLFGVMSGAIVGSAAYLWLVPDPKKMLLTPEWPAPAVAVWKSVAELLGKGLQSMPQSAMWACVCAAIIGIVAAILEKKGPEWLRRWIPSPSAFGLAFVLPATASVTIFLGGLLLWIASRVATSWTERYAIAIAAGLIAGESLFGIFTSMLKILVH
jgi:OPT family oligopeptide transporter